jgi:hypothetical protein
VINSLVGQLEKAAFDQAVIANQHAALRRVADVLGVELPKAVDGKWVTEAIGLINHWKDIAGTAISHVNSVNEELRRARASHHPYDFNAEAIAADAAVVEHDDTIERIRCDKAGQDLHKGCGWCAIHDRPAFECLCGGRRLEARKVPPYLEGIGPPFCGGADDCMNPVVHGEHWYDRIRWWCDMHVPMSGHYEFCGRTCAELVKSVKGP